MKPCTLSDSIILTMLYKNPSGLYFADIASNLLDLGVAFTYQELGKVMSKLVKNKQLLLSNDGIYRVQNNQL